MLLVVLRSESLSGMCTKLHTVGTSNNRDHTPRSLCYCLFAPHIYYMGVVLRAHSICGESCIQSNASGEVATKSLTFFNKKPHPSIARSFVWRLHPAWPPNPGHSTILLWSKSLSSMCAKLHTVVAINNRDHTPQSLCYCLFVPHIYGCCSFLCAFCLWWITHSAQHQHRGCNSRSLLGTLQNVIVREDVWCLCQRKFSHSYSISQSSRRYIIQACIVNSVDFSLKIIFDDWQKWFRWLAEHFYRPLSLSVPQSVFGRNTSTDLSYLCLRVSIWVVPHWSVSTQLAYEAVIHRVYFSTSIVGGYAFHLPSVSHADGICEFLFVYCISSRFDWQGWHSRRCPFFH